MSRGAYLSYYLEVLAFKGPLSFTFYIGIPFVLVLILIISEFLVLFWKETHGFCKYLNMIAGCLITLYFSWIVLFIFIFHNKLLTSLLEEKGVLDLLSVLTYLSCVFPLWGMVLTDMPWSSVRKRPKKRLFIHVSFLSLFLVVHFFSFMLGFYSYYFH